VAQAHTTAVGHGHELAVPGELVADAVGPLDGEAQELGAVGGPVDGRAVGAVDLEVAPQRQVDASGRAVSLVDADVGTSRLVLAERAWQQARHETARRAVEIDDAGAEADALRAEDMAGAV